VGRDPKLLWYAPGGHWVMVVYDQLAGSDDIAFYTSPDLKAWTYQSRISGFFECPDLFELPVDGDASNKRWVLSAADGAYRIGSFDGQVFTPETDKISYQYGNNYYAGQTFDSTPDGRRIRLAFGKATHATMPFSNMITFPVELSLHTTPLGVRLLPAPIAELAVLHDQAFSLTDVTLSPDTANPLAAVNAPLADIDADFAIGSASECGLVIRGVRITYQVASAELGVDSLAPAQGPVSLAAVNGHIRLRILVDRESLEIFGNDGLATLTVQNAADATVQGISVFTKGGDVTITQLQVFPLHSAWN
jgi:sucrose-6-phosphate hydrolase SacC (GH32 family)